jgi:PKD repeat protein
VLSAWTGTSGALNLIACNDDFNGGQSQITFSAAGGTTVYFMVGFCCGNGSNGGGSLAFSVDQVLPPSNDNFTNATPTSAVPFTDTVNLSAATTQPSEPTACLGLQNTVWYSFTPATTQSVTLRTDQYGAGVGVYTGTSLTNLSQVACNYAGQPALLQALAGTTYYIQVGAWCCDGFGPVTFHLEVAPNPVASFYFYPQDPSVFDAVQFQDNSYDPAGGVVSSWTWAFGD